MRSTLFQLALALTATFALSAPAAAEQVIFVSGLGGKCLDVEGGNIRQGARVIGYACNGQSNQSFDFARSGSGPIRIGGLCVDAKGGAGRQGDEIVLWGCNGGANQRWTRSNDRLVGINNMCIDLEFAAGHWYRSPFGNQRALLWGCNGGTNQVWFWGVKVNQARISGAVVIQPNQLVNIKPIPLSALVSPGGGNMVAAGGGNMVAAGGGNMVAAGGGN
ncbi:MAG: ricin-type beta-trefoil lectin domain protein [Polaromonas sp.]|nr:ricin-type beta-trefoil lectin domain protein [Polaromonas sp.]